ncbi:type VI secretion system baseplate subunit TssF [Desulfovibrio sp. ZJ369]|uniref:type VI secretion system baseplate subunit TssF n=1 Tax=Desulfovibrio sp. ZJ369 TaxID=2709793 RepID=UPI0013EE14C8|nr:type VI secretion system baseplate subunit TssF [Desulfovibrio sp. ZJ369]
MISGYYRQELDRLRELGAAFSRAHPALAPMLSAEATDPDVERLLEGTAFLSALIREKLEDELPEVIHALLGMVAPHYLRPLPSATLIAFTPRKALRECLTIPRGTELKSVEVEGAHCIFTTCADVRLAPLSLAGVSFARTGPRKGELGLRFSANGLPLEAVALPELRLSFVGSYADAARRIMLCLTRVREVRLIPEGGRGTPLRLPPSALRLTGFGADEALIPYPPESFAGFRHIQEYFLLPERFCTLALSGFDAWARRTSAAAFRLELDLDDLPDEVPPFRDEHVRLFVTPAVNIFPMSGEPITLDHRRESYAVRPAGHKAGEYEVYAVDKVTGFAQGSLREREYAPFMVANPGAGTGGVYALSSRLSVSGESVDVELSVGHAGEGAPAAEVLSLELRCTNGSLPEKLNAGDVTQPTASSPQLAEFTNLRAPTATVRPPLGGDTLWRLLSHLFLNYLSVARADNLRALLKLYIFNKTTDRAALLANINRVDGIADLCVVPAERFVRDRLMRGQNISLTLTPENFASDGDMYLFCCVLDVFLSNYAAVNTYTQLTAADSYGRCEFAWPARLGERTLL